MIKKIIIFFLFIFCFLQFLNAQSMYINEVMASNTKTISDKDGEFPDWIEIYNAQNFSVNLEGYSLSDDPNNLKKWSFGNIEIAPESFLLIFASDKNRNSSANNLHTNFKIKSEGESIIFSSPNGKILDSLFTGYLPADISLGRKPDGSDNWLYFIEATPGGSNLSRGYDSLPLIAPPQFSHHGGFYESQLLLTITPNNDNIQIFYTIDGSIPDENSLRYDKPIIINKTTVIRAVSVHTSGFKSKVITHTYFINEDRPLPVISIATSPENFDLLYENYDLEVPVHIEMYEKSGELEFSHNAGAEVFGGGSTEFEQKSIAIFFRKKYGSGSLKYRLFPDLPFEKYESFVLRNSGNDWWSTMFRDALITNGLMTGTAVDFQEYRPVVVYVNGKYWGIYNLREKVNEHYIKDHYNISEDKLDMLEYKEEITPNIIHGDLQNYNQLIDFLNNHDLSNDDNYQYVKSLIDIDNFIDYQIAEIYCANIDWPSNNNKFWRSREKSGRWRWILYDTDTGFGLWDEWWADGTPGWELDHIAHALSESESANEEEGWPNPPWSTFIFRKLLESENFKSEFINRFADYLNSRFSSEYVKKEINNFYQGIKEALPEHLERWDRTLDDYNFELNKLKRFVSKRPDFVREHLKEHFGTGETVTINLAIEPPDGGLIKLNSLLIEKNGWKGKYFSEIPIHLLAIPKPGFKFERWSYNSEPNQFISLNPKENLYITAFFKSDSSGSIVINEINYNSSESVSPGDWFELYNNSPTDIDLTGWSVKDSSDQQVFYFPQNTIIKKDHYLVVCKDLEKFKTVFPFVDNLVSGFDFGLSSKGDVIRIFNKNNELVDSVMFKSELPWPFEANGYGATLELINPNLNNELAENWVSSTNFGTPGQRNSKFACFKNSSIVNSPNEDREKTFNFPNPFMHHTKIKYSINVHAHVNITIFNILGQKVATLINKWQEANKYRIDWDGRNYHGIELPAGIYFYVIKVNYEVWDIGKMIKL